MEDVSIIGIELAKRDFQVDGPKAEGRLPTAAYPMCNMGAWRGLRPPSIPPKVALRGREWMAIASAITDHTAHHRGALTVYARVSGLVPPMPYMD